MTLPPTGTRCALPGLFGDDAAGCVLQVFLVTGSTLHHLQQCLRLADAVRLHQPALGFPDQHHVIGVVLRPVQKCSYMGDSVDGRALIVKGAVPPMSGGVTVGSCPTTVVGSAPAVAGGPGAVKLRTAARGG